MKKLLFALAAVAMLFTACGKEEEVAKKNQLTWNGETRELNSSMQIYHSTNYYFGGWTTLAEGADHSEYTFDCEVDEEALNKTFDLTGEHITDNSGYWIWMNKHFAPEMHWGYMNRQNDWNGNINETQFENASIFKSGTMTITLDDDGLTFSLDAVLKSDDTVTVDLYIPKEDFINR